MPTVVTPAVVLSSIKYGETSRVVRLATREAGLQSAMAKGVQRPRSRFGAALQPMSSGAAHVILRDHRDLQLLTDFELTRLRVELAHDVRRYAGAAALAEVMQRFGHPEPHPEAFDLFEGALDLLADAPAGAVEVVAIRMCWRLVSVLGFAPVLDRCARDGNPLPQVGDVAFSPRDGGVLCAECAGHHAATRLPREALEALRAMCLPGGELPDLDARHAASHRRLLSRYIQLHLAEGTALPGLAFWERPDGRPG